MRRALATTLVTAAVIALLWAFGGFLPGWSEWENKTFEIGASTDAGTAAAGAAAADEAAAGAAAENTCRVTLKNKRLTVKRGDETLFSSPRLWFVSNAFAADMTGDGQQELIMTVWKHGSYGDARPIWDKHNSPAFSQHVFIYQVGAQASGDAQTSGDVQASGGMQARDSFKIAPLWMSSAVPHPIASAQIDKDNRLHLTEPSGTETVWVWDSWGLKLYEGKSGEDLKNEGSKNAADDDTQPNSSDSNRLILLAVGDNLAHDSVCKQAWQPSSQSFDFTPIYEKAASRISSCDLAVVAQETILVHDPAHMGTYPEFATPESIGDALAGAGFDIVLGANNHAFDKDVNGLSDTLSFWKDKHPDITLLGLHDSAADYDRIDYIEKNGIRLALFDYTEHLNGHKLPQNEPWRVNVLGEPAGDKAYDGGTDGTGDGTAKLLADLQTAESHADLSLCFLHIGEEYAKSPAPAVRTLSEKLIDAGADVIICSHPHVLQPVEEMRTPGGARGIVYYSLGNFMSHQRKPETVLGGAAVITIEKHTDASGLTGAETAGNSEQAGAEITDCQLLGTVCHFASGVTQVYFLDDYTEELAAEHFLNQEKTQFTLKSLKEDFAKIAEN